MQTYYTAEVSVENLQCKDNVLNCAWTRNRLNHRRRVEIDGFELDLWPTNLEIKHEDSVVKKESKCMGCWIPRK